MSSYSHVFRSIVESIPVNADGVVDQANGDRRLRVALVAEENVIHYEWTAIQNPDVHGWAAIQDVNGTWRYYDLAKGVCRVPTSSVCTINHVYEDTLVWYY